MGISLPKKRARSENERMWFAYSPVLRNTSRGNRIESAIMVRALKRSRKILVVGGLFEIGVIRIFDAWSTRSYIREVFLRLRESVGWLWTANSKGRLRSRS